MIIEVDDAGKKAITSLCDVAVRHFGLKAIDEIAAILNAIVVKQCPDTPLDKKGN